MQDLKEGHLFRHFTWEVIYYRIQALVGSDNINNKGYGCVFVLVVLVLVLVLVLILF